MRFKQATEYSNINVIEIEKVNNYYFIKVEYKRKLESGQLSEIPFELGDKFELNYSFKIGIKFWGSYIERGVSFFKEDTFVYFDKDIPNFDKNQINVSVINMQGKIQEVPTYMCQWHVNDPKYYKLVLPLEAIDIVKANDEFFRIMWDANAIFNRQNLNTKNACLLGLGTALRHSGE